MITFDNACLIASDYYKNNLNVLGLAEAREAKNCYIFGSGKSGSINIGGAIICVQKTDGKVSVLKFPSKENTALYNSASKIEIPSNFISE